MSETPDELEPFPADGPASLSGVKLRVKITDNEDDVELGDLVAATNAAVKRMRIASEARGKDDWADFPDVVLGANMLAARLWRRKDTAGGVEVFGDTIAYVRRNDPDIAQLLQLGDWSTPAVG